MYLEIILLNWIISGKEVELSEWTGHAHLRATQTDSQSDDIIAGLGDFPLLGVSPSSDESSSAGNLPRAKMGISDLAATICWPNSFPPIHNVTNNLSCSIFYVV